MYFGLRWKLVVSSGAEFTYWPRYDILAAREFSFNRFRGDGEVLTPFTEPNQNWIHDAVALMRVGISDVCTVYVRIIKISRAISTRSLFLRPSRSRFDCLSKMQLFDTS